MVPRSSMRILAISSTLSIDVTGKNGSHTQNEKIAQVSNDSIVVGIDISSEKHCARAFTSRGIELTRKAFTFANTGEGFEEFERWLKDQMDNSRLTKAIIGFEPTGHYWFNLADYLDEQNIRYVLVPPARCFP